ncbi:MAG: single-stranded DNA-binding protein [Desulfovibrio sp.]|nr:single-stranded DNA-binding protein [Desulfovibrio sp.]
MLNKVMIIGRLGRDPELRYTQNGTPVTSLNVATDESYTDRDGNKVERTEWHRVSVFQRMAENCANFLSKGSLVYVEGSLQTRKWQDQQGQDRYSTDIKAQRVQFLDRKNDRDAGRGFANDDDAGQPPYRSNAPHGGQSGYDQRPQHHAPTQPPAENRTPQSHEELGPAFPSEAAMDEVPF